MGSARLKLHDQLVGAIFSLDVPQLFVFLGTTQPEAFKKLAMTDDPKDINRLKFLARVSSEIGKRGVIDVLRKGVDPRSPASWCSCGRAGV